jgi:imidazolonepropionase
MSEVLVRGARVLTMLGAGETRPPSGGRRGVGMRELGVLERGDVLVEGGLIAAVGAEGSVRASPKDVVEIEARGRVLMPGFVDCHTHACWGGSRIDEWEMRLQGRTYQEIMAAGGGIMSTVRATRAVTVGELACDLIGRLDRMVRLGSTTIEVKTGYGLTLEHELKMLAAIRWAHDYCPATVVPTALLGHAVDPEYGERGAFVEHVCGEVLAAASAAHPGIAVDAFCEGGAWTVEETVRLLGAAAARGHPVRVHADQFTSLGMVERAIGMGARSVDHLEASTEETIARLGASGTFGVGLPVCGLHVDGRYADLRGLVDAGGAACVATNYNPGSAPCPSMGLAVGLAVRFCRLTPPEALVAATVNPACLLGLTDRGYIAPGARADLVLLHDTDERAVAYEVGDNPVEVVMCAGEIVDEPGGA